MNIKEMHYDFKFKLNAIDSQKYRDLQIPQIDWRLNEAHEMFAKMIAEPRVQSQVGFELNQRTIDDIRTVVIDQTKPNGIVPTVFDNDEKSYLALLPVDYMFYLRSGCYATKGACIDKVMRVQEIQHDDENEVSPFDRSNFEWRKVNIRFMKEGIRLFTDKTFTPTKLCISYIKQLVYMHNAEDFEGGTYRLFSGGTLLTGSVSSELPPQVHREIVDLAVFITAGDMNLSSYGLKMNKLKIDQTI